MGIFNRKGAIAPTPAGKAAKFSPPGVYQLSWERQQMPDPGAQAFAWETLDLVKFNIVNSGFGPNRYQRLTNVPLYVGQATPLVGIPTIGGTLALQPLVNTG